MNQEPCLPLRWTELFESRGHVGARVTVSVSLYNYESTVLEALETTSEQTLEHLHLIVVDDSSDDNGLQKVLIWAVNNASRFGSVRIASNDSNSGLARTRNLGFELATTEYVFVLDADNRMYPRCLERLLEGIAGTDLAFVWGIGEVFGDESRLISATKWDPDRLAIGPYIDAAALIKREAWSSVGGFREMPAMGWEDYDFCCRIHENGLAGQVVPEMLWSYRTHKESMLGSLNGSHYSELRRWMVREHPWLRLPV